MKLTVQVFDGATVRLGEAVKGFVSELKTIASNAQVEAIAAEFPGGTAIDQACITLCNDALAAINALPPTLNKVENAVEAIYEKLAVDIAQVKHNNPKRTIGFYLQLIGAVAEDAVLAIEGSIK